MGKHREEAKNTKTKRHDKTLNVNLYKHAFKITEKMFVAQNMLVCTHEYMAR